ncbi:hypothetical protein C4552_04270 [Candidatus Parcubacteria bacterium]|nr:MAG: hypothetical protein C4552_04270 [Candidatus Parcubacteria bacterium]
MEFIGQTIRVMTKQEPGWLRPVSFRLDGKEHTVVRVDERWEEHTLGDSWWQRRHRVHYAVTVADGRRFELYWDRGARGQGETWVLLKELADESAD